MRIAIVLTSHGELGETGRSTGFYVSEAAEPWEIFTEAGHEVEVVSVAGGVPPRDGENADDPVQRRFLDVLGETVRVADLEPERYDAVFFAGGHGAMWDFPGDPGIGRLTRGVHERGGVVAAVCHGPAALVDLELSDGKPLVAGRRVAAFTGSEEEAVGLTAVVPFPLAERLREQGAEHVPAADFAAQVVTDGRLVTGQNPASARGVAEEVVRVLAGE
ncbi:type 1 glutamine amidotransferase domain-containing protein [Streptosporangium sp. NPDC020072]|uniref:type 1 glutamine amidotransferase domain-containing protein n=1 Tax=Streptosporangium sp. NPDC020072 TaxID=3154788 RepID=UPI00343299C1